jgi:formate dehydrogenase iron-sulfur subunit
VQRGLSLTVSVVGLLMVGCSVMLYAVTGRTWWQPSTSGTKFYGTTLVLGLSLTLLVLTAALATGFKLPLRSVSELCQALVIASGAKLFVEFWIFGNLRSSQMTDLKRTALLLRGELRGFTQARFGLGLAGGVVVPALLKIFYDHGGAQPGAAPVFFAALSLLCLLAGELLERSLFFMAAAAPKMPGAVGS